MDKENAPELLGICKCNIFFIGYFPLPFLRLYILYIKSELQRGINLAKEI